MADMGNPELSGHAWSRKLGGEVQPMAPQFKVGDTVSLGGNRRSRIEERDLKPGGIWAYKTPAFGWQTENTLQADPVKLIVDPAARKVLDDIRSDDIWPAKAEVDMVNHPPHYQSGRFEVIEVLEEFFEKDPLLWQVGKYIMRAGKKGYALEDLQKAEWYLKRRIEQFKSGRAG